MHCRGEVVLFFCRGANISCYGAESLFLSW